MVRCFSIDQSFRGALAEWIYPVHLQHSIIVISLSGGACMMVVSGGIASTDVLVLFQVQVAGLSPCGAAPELMRMLVAAALFPGTSISLDRQSAALL